MQNLIDNIKALVLKLNNQNFIKQGVYLQINRFFNDCTYEVADKFWDVPTLGDIMY